MGFCEDYSRSAKQSVIAQRERQKHARNSEIAWMLLADIYQANAAGNSGAVHDLMIQLALITEARWYEVFQGQEGV